MSSQRSSELEDNGTFDETDPNSTGPSANVFDLAGFEDLTDDSADDEEPPYEPVSFPRRPIGGLMLMCLAVLFTFSGAGLALWTVSIPGGPPGLLSPIGVTPFAIVMTGLLLAGIAGLRRHQDLASAETDDRIAALQEVTDYIAERVEGSLDRDDVSVLSVGLQRIDEKISNLSRATKMYGKPLVDVASRVQHAAGHLQELEQALGGVVEKVESSSQQLANDLNKLIEATHKADPIQAEKFDELVAATRKTTSLVEQIRSEFEGFSQPTPTALLNPLQDAIDRVQHEVAGIAASITQLQSVPPQPAEPAPAPRPTAGAAATPATAPAPAASPRSAGDGLAHSIAGERKTQGKNVLGAIARLRQMRN